MKTRFNKMMSVVLSVAMIASSLNVQSLSVLASEEPETTVEVVSEVPEETYTEEEVYEAPEEVYEPEVSDESSEEVTWEEPAEEEPVWEETTAEEPVGEEPAASSEENSEEDVEESETEEETEEESETESEEESDPNADVETAADWEATLPSLTGVWGDDIVRVAQSQLGYTESTRNFEKVEDATAEPGSETASKKKGYTRYGAWYGSPYADWCAMFASFCLYYAGVPTSVMPEDSGVVSWIQTLQGAGIYADKSTAYQPVSGDLIFFAMGSQGADHVGIIESTVTATDENGKSYVTGIYTIEGNSGNAVRENYYDVSDSRILGYGVLNGQSGIDEETKEEWEATIPTLTGELANDLTLVAESQLGYTESKRNFSLSSDWSKKGYTRYGAWYGNPYEDWSTMFVSFCLTYADSGLAAAGSASALIDVVKEADLFEDADYVPSAGDVVFLSKGGDGADASAIIERVDTALDENGDEVVAALAVIEGDSNDAVREATYFSANGNIAGYAKIAGEKWDGFFDPEHPEWGGILIADIEGDLGGTVTAEIPAGAFDETVTMTAEAAVYAPEDADSELLDAVLSAAGKTEDDNIYGLYVINITFISEDGGEVEPAAAVSIAVDTSKAPVDVSAGKANKDTLQKTIYHINKESGAANAVGNVVAMDDDNKMTGMAFDSEAFSPFVLLLSDDEAEALAAGDVYSVTYVADNDEVVEFPEDNPTEVADGGTLYFSVIIEDGYGFESVTANGSQLGATNSEDIEDGARYQHWYSYSGADGNGVTEDVEIDVTTYKGQIIDGYGVINILDQESQSNYVVTIQDVPTNTPVSLSYRGIEITDEEGNHKSNNMTGRLYYVPRGEEGNTEAWTQVSYFMLDGNKKLGVDEDDESIIYFEVVPYDADDNAFNMTLGSLYLKNTAIVSARADIMPLQDNLLCSDDEDGYTQEFVGAAEMSSNKQTYYYPGYEGDVVSLADLTNGQVEKFYYGTLTASDDEDDDGYYDIDGLKECEYAKIVNVGTGDEGAVEYYLYPLDEDGEVVEDYGTLYMEYDQVYSFDVEVNSIVNEHTEDNGDVYLWKGTEYYVDQYKNQGYDHVAGYTRSQNTLANCGVWVQLGRIREEQINSGAKTFSDYADVSYEDMLAEGVSLDGYDSQNAKDTAEANAPYGIVGPYEVESGATDVTTETVRVTGHIGDEFTASQAFGKSTVYMVTDESEFVTDWINLGSHASDNGYRGWFYWINDYFFLNDNEDELEYVEIVERDGEIRLEADEMGESGLGEEYDVWNIDLYTKRESVVKADMVANPTKYTDSNIGFDAKVNTMNHIQLRMNGTVQIIDENGDSYFGVLDVLSDEDAQGNVNTDSDSKAPYISYSIDVIDPKTGEKFTITDAQYIKMENELEANQLKFNDYDGNEGYYTLVDRFDPEKTKIHVKINFVGTLTSGSDEGTVEPDSISPFAEDGAKTIVYTEDDPFVYEADLTEEQLREGYDTCPVKNGYDVEVYISDAVLAEIESDTQTIIYKVWDDDNNEYESRGDVDEIEVTLERSKDGETWELVREDMDDENSEAKTFTISAPIGEDGEKDLTATQWSLVLDAEALGFPLTFETEDEKTGYYEFRIASEDFSEGEGTAEGYTYNTVITGTTVTNTLRRDNMDISGEKLWYDVDGTTPLAPEDTPSSVIITLYQNGHYYDRITIGSGYDNGWTFEFTDLPVWNGGEKYVYTLGEMTSDGRSVSDGDSVLIGEDWFHIEIEEHESEDGEITYEFKNVKNPDPVKDEDIHGNGTYGDTGEGVQVGDTITYKIDYQNYLNVPATVTITDVLDEGLDYVEGSASEGGTYDEGTRTITWVLEDVEAKAGVSVTFKATVNENALEKNEVENTASAQVNDNPAVDTNTVYNPIPDKDVDADGDGNFEDSGMQVKVGDTLVYKIDYENPDDDPATVTITDEVDVGLDFVSATDNGSYVDEGRLITWTINDVQPHTTGSVYFTAIVNENALEKNVVENTATVQVGEHEAQQTKTVWNPLEQWKDVDADGDGSYGDSGSEVNVGDTLTYIVYYFNDNDETATVTITDVLDEGLDFVGASDNGTYDESTRTVTWTLSAAALTGGNVTFTATVNANALVKDEVNNTALVLVDNEGDYTNTVYNPVPDKDEDIHGDDTYGDSGLAVSVGTTITYKINYQNSDDLAATVIITDVLDIGLDFVSASDGGTYNEETRTITWTLENVAPHSVDGYYVTFEATVNEDALEKNLVENTATVKVGDHPAQNTRRVWNPLMPEPEKGVDTDGDSSYEDDGESVQVGDTVSYEITFENPYDEEAVVTITDVLDDGLDFDSASDGGIYDGTSRTITWEITLDAYEEGSVTFSAVVNENALVRNVVDNTATLQYDHDPATSVGTNTTHNPVPDKDVDADGDGVFEDSGMLTQVGETLVYEISYENPDDEAATVTITDELDIGLDFVDATDEGSYDPDTRTITWVLEDVDPHTNGSVKFTALVNEYATILGYVENTAVVQVGNHDEQQTKTVVNPVPGKDVDADGDGEFGDSGLGVKVGDEVTYEISYTNGYETEAKVTITDTLDPGLDYVSSEPEATVSTDEDGNTVLIWTIEGVEPGVTGSVSFTATVNEDALVVNEIENTAEVQVDDDPAVETNTTYNPVPDKDEDIHGDKSWGDSGLQVKVGDTITYKIDYQNADDEPATVTITDVLDTGLDYVEGSASDKGIYDEDTRTITWVIENVAPHSEEGYYVTFEATVNEEALVKNYVENTATVQVGDHPAQDTRRVWNPLEEYKDVDADGDGEYGDSGLGVKVGDTLTYVISYVNENDKPATVTITDPLDEGLDFVEASDDGIYDDATRTVTWVFEVPAESGGTVTFSATVNETALVKNEVDNTATILVDNEPIVTNTVYNTIPDKDVDVHGDGSYGDSGVGVEVGQELTYIIEYFNGYEDPATVTITDTLDAGLDFVSASDDGTYDPDTRTITWTIEEAEALTGGSVTFIAKVNENAMEKNEVENIASVQVNDDPAVDTNKVYNPIPDKDVDIHGDGSYGDSGLQVEVGQTLTYKITYQNSDDEAATVTITDVLDPGLDFVKASDEGSYDDATRTIIWVIEDVAPHSEDELYVTFDATVNEDALIKNEVDNTATVQVGDHPSQDTRIVYNPVPGKGVDVNGDSEYDDDGESVRVGDTLTYEISYFNGYDETATVVITDVLDTGLTFVEASDGGVYEDGTITWTLTVGAQSGGSVTFTATVNENAVPNGNVVQNEALVKVNDDPEVSTNPVYNPVPDKDVDADGDGTFEDNGMQVQIGDDLEYKIDYENPDDEAATVTITDELDIGLTFVGASDEGSYDPDTRTITWVIEDVKPHTNGSVYFTATVNEDAVEKNYVENTATVQVGEHAEQQTKTVYNPVPSKDVDADSDGKEGDSGEDVHVGDTLVYTINYFNGYDVAEEVLIEDVLDLGLDYVSSDPEAVVSVDADGHTVLDWDIPDVDPHTAGSVTFTATVNDSGLHEDEILNVATVSIRNYSVLTNIVDNPVPDKDVDADGDGVYGDSGLQVEVGDTLTYMIEYFNGYEEDELKDIVITDVLDEGLDFVEASDGGSYDESSRTITWTIPDVPGQSGGFVTFKATVNENALIKNEVENTATVQVGDDPAIETNTVYNPVPDKDVDIHGDETYGDSGLQVEVGQTLTYIIDYFNGYDDPADVVITDTLDVGLTFKDASGTYTYEDGTITWTISNVPAHTGGRVTFTATVNDNAVVKNEVENTATVKIKDDPSVDTNTVRNPVSEKDVDVNLDDDKDYGDNGVLVGVGQTLTYKITYKNSYDEPADVTIKDTLDKNVQYVSESASDGGSYNALTRTITWTIMDVQPGESGYVTFQVVVLDGALTPGEVENTAKVKVGNGPEIDTNTVVNPVEPKEEPVKYDDADGDGDFDDDLQEVEVGDEITYMITYKNHHGVAETVTITDALDANVQFVSASDSGKYDPESHTVTWTLKNVPAFESGYVTVTVKVLESAVTPGNVYNTAKVQIGNDKAVETNQVVNPVEPPEEETPSETGTPGTTTTPGTTDTGTTTTSVKTADDTPIEMMVFLMAAALMLLAVCAGYTYRRRRAEK